jgi:hypothetical protein
VGLALCWPLGPLSAAITIPVLVVAACVLFPAVGLFAAAAAVAGWWLAS